MTPRDAAMKIPLTPGQAVTIHGWANPKETLSWTDILSKSTLTFRFLITEARIPQELLHKLQPDIAAWKQANKVTLEDAVYLTQWPAHPVRDLRADLSDLINTNWPAEVRVKTGVTYADLLETGLTPETMGMFNFTLLDWSNLGLTKADAEKIPAHSLARLFNLPRADVLRCLK